MKAVKLSLPVGLLAMGLAFLISSFSIPPDSLRDNRYGHLYFPVGVSALMVVLCLVYLIREVRELNKPDADIARFLERKTVLRIGATVAMALAYAAVFEWLGYVISSVLFLGGVLFLLNGRKRWLLNGVTAVAYALISYLLISQLTIYLPAGVVLESLGLA